MSDKSEEEIKAALREQRVDAAVAVLLILEDDERLEAMHEFCLHCGSNTPGCQCWNDE